MKKHKDAHSNLQLTKRYVGFISIIKYIVGGHKRSSPPPQSVGMTKLS
jgi:hypothetical protein